MKNAPPGGRARKICREAKLGSYRCSYTEEPLFCLSDICKAVDLKNPSSVKSRLDRNDVQLIDLYALRETEGVIIGNSLANFVTESGFYDVILQSNSNKVKPFRHWITNEVLPSIRKHGVYATDETIDKIIANPDFGIKLLTELKEEREKRVESERQNAILMHVNKTYTSTEIAKECNLKSANELNKLLNAKGIQFKSGGTWVLYSKYANLGYEEIKQEVLDNGRVIYHRKFTQIGRKFILNLLKNQKNVE